MKKRLWDEVEEAVKEGKVPNIDLSPASRIIDGPKKTGRPRKYPTGTNLKIHRVIMKTPTGQPMICRMPGCRHRLKIRQRDICCSPACKAELKSMCEGILQVINGDIDPEEFPMYWRAKGPQRWKKGRTT